MPKMRGVMVVDFDAEDIQEAAAIEARLKKLAASVAAQCNQPVDHQAAVKERRGNGRVDLAKAKFRSS